LNTIAAGYTKENTQPSTVSNKQEISNDNFESSQYKKYNDTGKSAFKKNITELQF
jgi:hypothetical protein